MTEDEHPHPPKGKLRRSPKGRGKPQHYLYRLSFRLLGTAPPDSGTEPSAGVTLHPMDQGREHYVEDRMVRVEVPEWADPRGFTEYPSSVFLLGSLEMIGDPRYPEELKTTVLIQVLNYLYGQKGPLLAPVPPNLREWVWKSLCDRAEESGEPPEIVFLQALQRAFVLAEPSSGEGCSLEQSILRQVGKHVTEDFLGPEREWRQLLDPDRRGPEMVDLHENLPTPDSILDSEGATGTEDRGEEEDFLFDLIESERKDLPPKLREALEVIEHHKGDKQKTRAELRERGWSDGSIRKARHEVLKRLKSRRESESR